MTDSTVIAGSRNLQQLSQFSYEEVESAKSRKPAVGFRFLQGSSKDQAEKGVMPWKSQKPNGGIPLANARRPIARVSVVVVSPYRAARCA